MIARVTADAVSGEILDTELARDTTSFFFFLNTLHLKVGPRDIQTILIFECEGCLVVGCHHGPEAEVAQGVGPGPLVER